MVLQTFEKFGTFSIINFHSQFRLIKNLLPAPVSILSLMQAWKWCRGYCRTQVLFQPMHGLAFFTEIGS